MPSARYGWWRMPDRESTVELTVHPDIAAALARFDGELIGDRVPSRLPLLDRMRGLFSDRDRFVDLDALFVQHQLGPFVPRVGAMVADGLAIERAWFVDIPYSTNSVAHEALVDLGCVRDQLAESFDDPLAPYGPAQAHRVRAVVRRLAERRGAPSLLVVDDGAYFVRFLRRALVDDPELARRF